MIHDILSESVRKEIDSIRSKFPHDKNRSSIIESLLIIQHENSGYLNEDLIGALAQYLNCLLYTSPSPRDQSGSRMPSSA